MSTIVAEMSPLVGAARALQGVIKGASDAALAPLYAAYCAKLHAELRHWQVPKHVGFIMDGNRRFARAQQAASVLAGHRRGADKLDEVMGYCERAGVHVVSVFGFSLENFDRDPGEVEGLMNLFEQKFTELVTNPRIHREQIKIRSFGRTALLPASVQRAIAQAEQATAHYTRRLLNVGIAYSGREAIVEAFRRYLTNEKERGGDLAQAADNLSPAHITSLLDIADCPDPDLIIRTSGEVRLSGFLLWESSYSEFYFSDVHWPAFREIDFLRALRSYHYRKRRFGR